MSDDEANGTSTPGRAAGEPAASIGTGVDVLETDMVTPTGLVRDLARLGVRLQHVSSRRTGLSPADLSALSILVRGVVGPADLARQLDVSTAAATGIVDRLAARGHVERRPIPDDRRRTALHITDSGRDEHTRHLSFMVEGLTALEQEFDAAETAVIQRYLHGAIDVITRAVTSQPAAERP